MAMVSDLRSSLMEDELKVVVDEGAEYEGMRQ